MRSLNIAWACAALLSVHGCEHVSSLAESTINPVDNELGEAEPPPLPDELWLAFRSMFAADMHADSLLWGRDLREASTRGHVDLPRLIDGGIDLQVFAIVTRAPLSFYDNDNLCLEGCIAGDGIDPVTLLQWGQGRRIENWFVDWYRALDQARRLREMTCTLPTEDAPEYGDCAAADGRVLVQIESAADLKALVAHNASGTGPRAVGALLAMEGGHALNNDLTLLQQLYGLGLRMIAPTHRFDNNLGGSSEGCLQYGLTANGRALLREAIDSNMVVDLAHASSAVIGDALALLRDAGVPFVVSHTGIQQTLSCPRNLTDDQVREIAAAGGVIGVGFWRQAIGPGGVTAIVATMLAVHDIIESGAEPDGIDTSGIDPWDHIAFGSDFDGAVTAPFDASGYRALYTELWNRLRMEHGLSDDEAMSVVRRISGGNVCRVLAEVLPGGGPDAAADICA